jgi:uncharacterized protein YkwD
MNKIASLLVLTSVAATLSACGGGGGGSSTGAAPVATTPTAPVQTTPAPSTPAAPTVTPADLQTTVPTATYAAGSQELGFFTLLNDFRGKMGLGLVAQNVALDTATANHARYMLGNPDVNFSEIDPKTGVAYMHEEDAARPGFTGAVALDRAKFAKYSGSWVGEQVTYGLGSGAPVALSNLIASVYHRQGLMFQSPRDFGISAGTDRYQTTVLSFGIGDKRQRNASDYVGVYPADKQANVGLSTYPELPSPYPELSANDFATKSSFPVTVVTEESTTLKADSFTVTEAGQTAPLDARLLTADNDPNKLLGKNTAYLVGKASFKPNTTYNVSFKGTVNGAALSKAWSFTTGQ